MRDVEIHHDSLAPRRTGHEDFPHPALSKTLISRHVQVTPTWLLQVHQPQEVLKKVESLGRTNRA